MSVNEKMTAIADEIRAISGGSEKLGLDAMAENVKNSNEEIALQKALLEQAIAALEGKVDPELYDKGYADGYEAGYNANQANLDMVLVRSVVSLKTNAKSFGAYSLSYCNKLVNLEAPEVESLGSRAISECGALEKVDFPKLKSIGANALRYNDKLTTIIIRTDTVCSLNSAASVGGSTIIYVPDELVDSYKTASKWVDIADRIKPISELEETA